MNTIKIGDKVYPCRFTMGAAMEFKNRTGYDIDKITGGSLSDVMVLMWCCVRSACRVDGVEFDMEPVAMGDLIDVDSLMKWQNEAFAGNGKGGGADASKKKAKA